MHLIIVLYVHSSNVKTPIDLITVKNLFMIIQLARAHELIT